MIIRFRRWFTLPVLVLSFSLAQSSLQATPPARKPAPEVQALLDQASKELKQNNFDAAIKLDESAAQKAVELNDPFGQGKSLSALGLAYYTEGNLPKAGDAFAASRDAFAKANDLDDEVGMTMDVAVIKDNTGHRDEAKPLYLQVLDYAQKTHNQRQLANINLNLAMLDSSLSNYSESLKYAVEAQAEYHALGDLRWEAEALGMIGNDQQDLGQFDAAKASFNKGIAVARRAKSPRAESTLLMSLSQMSTSRGDFVRALDLDQQALSIQVELKDLRFQGKTQKDIGIIYGLTGQSRLAIQSFQEAGRVAAQTGDVPLQSEALTDLGVTYEQAHMDDLAEPALTQALGLARSIKDLLGQGSCLGTLGTIQSRQKEYAKAVSSFEAAIEIFHHIGQIENEANTIDALAGSLIDQGKYELAIPKLKLAALMLEKMGEREFLASTLGNIGLAEMKEGKLAEAEDSYRKCIDLSEAVRLTLGGSSEGKSEFLARRINQYQDYISVLIKRGKIAAAFDVAQKTKGRALLDLLEGGQVSIETDMTPDERKQEHDLKAEADRLNVAMVKEGAQNEVGAKKRFAALQVQLRQAEDNLSAFTVKLFARRPDLSRMHAYSTATLAQAGAELSEDTALLEYVMSDEPVVFVVTSHRGKPHVSAVPLKLSGDNLAKLCTSLREALSNPALPYEAQSRTLYKTLISPIESRLAGKTRLVICPDGPLWDVSFAALSNGLFLAQRFEIDYDYSATGAYAALVARKTIADRRPLLIVANPNFGGARRFGDNPLVPDQRPIEPPSRPIEPPSRPIEPPSRPIEPPSRPIEPPSRPIEPPSRDLSLGLRTGIVDLPGTQQEAEAIAKLFPYADVLTGDHAQESTLLREAGRYRYLHIASHAFFNDAAPMLSSIVLAAPNSPDEDGFLTARTIFGMKLHADLVVLSACNTARGAKSKGEGLVGLSWALFAAGVPAQVVSQWSVDDRATATLMTRFYANLKRGQSKGAALRNAEISFLANKDSKWRRPYYWAPFILVGDWR